MSNRMSRRQADIYSHYGHYPVWMTNSIPFVQYQSVLPFIRYGYFKTNPWKSLVKAILVVKCQSHVAGVATNRLYASFSFHINWSCITEIQPFKCLTMKMHGQVNVVAKANWDGYSWGLVIIRYVHFSFRGNRIIWSQDIANWIFH